MRRCPRALSPGARCDRSMRWADVYVCMLADGVALRNRCPQGQADPRAAGPHPRRARSMRWADVYVPHVSPTDGDGPTSTSPAWASKRGSARAAHHRGCGDAPGRQPDDGPDGDGPTSTSPAWARGTDG